MMLSSLNYISTGGIQHVLSPWMALRHCGCFWAQTEKAQEERLRDARGLLLVPTKLLLVPTIIQKFQIYSRPRYTMESCIHCIMEVRKLLFNGISIPLYSKQQNLDFVVFFFFCNPLHNMIQLCIMIYGKIVYQNHNFIMILTKTYYRIIFPLCIFLF